MEPSEDQVYEFTAESALHFTRLWAEKFVSICKEYNDVVDYRVDFYEGTYLVHISYSRHISRSITIYESETILTAFKIVKPIIDLVSKGYNTQAEMKYAQVTAKAEEMYNTGKTKQLINAYLSHSVCCECLQLVPVDKDQYKIQIPNNLYDPNMKIVPYIQFVGSNSATSKICLKYGLVDEFLEFLGRKFILDNEDDKFYEVKFINYITVLHDIELPDKLEKYFRKRVTSAVKRFLKEN